MKLKARILAASLAAAIAVSMAGCGSSAASSESTSAAASSEAATESIATTGESEVGTYPIVSDPITVKGLVVGRSTNTRTDRIVWNKVSEVTGINIEWECIDEEALATYLAGSDWPDFIHYNLSTSLVNDYGVVGGRFVNYNDYIDYMPNLQAAMEKYPLMKKASTQSNGEMYSLPGYEVSATTSSARPYVRTDVLEAAGLEMPKTTQEFHDALATLKDKFGVASFIPEFSNDESYWGPMLFAAFGKQTNDIDDLSRTYPIITTRGKYGGGIKVLDGYRLDRKYLNPAQQHLLKRLAKTLSGQDRDIMESILRDFALKNEDGL